MTDRIEPAPQSAEQQARDLLDRMEVPNAQSYSAGELVELANLIAQVDHLRRTITRAHLDALRLIADANESESLALWQERADDPDGSGTIALVRSLADVLASYLPPE